MRVRLLLTPLLLSLLAFGRAQAETTAPGLQCRAAIAAAERLVPVPDHLLAAIARVESGRRDGDSGDWHPWPWTINAEGQGAFFETKAAAIAAVRALQARGVRSIDVGCMQVNLMHHPDAFASLEEAFDPRANVAYAARFLSSLFGQTGSWANAAAFYHSATPELGDAYRRQVLAVWPEESRRQGAAASYDPGRIWAASLRAAPSNRVAVMMPVGPASAMRIIPLASGGAGRSLDTYRAAPIAMISRPRRIGG